MASYVSSSLIIFFLQTNATEIWTHQAFRTYTVSYQTSLKFHFWIWWWSVKSLGFSSIHSNIDLIGSVELEYTCCTAWCIEMNPKAILLYQESVNQPFICFSELKIHKVSGLWLSEDGLRLPSFRFIFKALFLVRVITRLLFGNLFNSETSPGS